MEPAQDPFIDVNTEPAPDVPSNPVVDDLEPPRASYLASEASTPRDSYVQTPSNSSPLLPDETKPEDYADPDVTGVPSAKRPRYLLYIIPAIFVIIILVVVLPVYFAVVKPRQHHTAAANSGPTNPLVTTAAKPNPTGKPGSTSAISGGDGSTVTTANGSTFIYNNSFGGFWVDDPNNPFNDNAQPNSWTPPLNTSWTWGVNQVYGVNLGGWFVLEPFITPAIYDQYPGAVDEWTLSTLMAADTANGGLSQLESHYNTFITEEDFAQMAGAGLNWIRLPIPFWAIETWPGEPFLAGTSWKYILKAFAWARKYGIRVNLDLHTCPGSQNGFNHSGKVNVINFLDGVMGVANAQRMLNYIRIITEFISQPEYQNVVPIFSIINEPLLSAIGQGNLETFYLEAHDMIRGITGFGAGNGPYIAIHDGFQGPADWAGLLTGADRLILDTHPYFAFDGSDNTSPIGEDGTGGVWPGMACSNWADTMNTSQTAFGVTIAGEFSTGFNDCGLYLLGVGTPATYPDCSIWQDSSNWNDTVIEGIQQFALANMDSLQEWFFWTWKVAPATSGIVESPLWSYQLGLQQGFMPTDPRQSKGVCASLGDSGNAFDGTYETWQTGGAGAGQVAATVVAEFGQWPPASIAEVGVGSLPTYTPTGSVITLSPPTFTSLPSSVTVGDGWYDSSDTAGAPTPIAGCTYPNAWDAQDVVVPPLCN